MTLILAGKTKQGILFYYDRTLIVKNIFPLPLFLYLDKVNPICDGKIAVGLSYENSRFKDEIAKINEAILHQRRRTLVKTLEDFVATQQETQRRFLPPSKGDYSHASIHNIQYLFGIIEHGEPTLLVSSETGYLEKSGRAGIGSGMYPYLDQKFIEGYRPGQDISVALEHFEVVMNSAKRAARRRNDYPLRGLGIGLLSSQGYQTMYTHPNP